MALKLLCDTKSPECKDVFLKLERSTSGSSIFLIACDESGKPFGAEGIILSITRDGLGYRWKGGLASAPEWVKKHFQFDSHSAVKRWKPSKEC